MRSKTRMMKIKTVYMTKMVDSCATLAKMGKAVGSQKERGKAKANSKEIVAIVGSLAIEVVIAGATREKEKGKATTKATSKEKEVGRRATS